MKVGILGGGQLGAMLAESVVRLGATPIVYEPDPEAPATRRVREVVQGSFEDREALAAFMAGCDVLTYEREELPVDILREAAAGRRFFPDLRVLEIAQDRALEKSFLAQNQLECVRHLVVAPGQTLEEAVAQFGCPAIAKTTRGGYDGKGQFLIRDPREAVEVERSMPKASWVLEEPLDIVAEASGIVVCSEHDEVVFPVAENQHRHHVLDRTLVPSQLPAQICARIRELALSAARSFELVGILAVEFFIASKAGADREDEANWQVLVNELAPRPHNSGHLMSRACSFGQFDALARVLVGAPLCEPKLQPGFFCMGNLLGDVWLAQGRSGDELDLSAWKSFPDVVEVNLYGKKQAADRRKMGHTIVMASTADAALERAETFRLALKFPRD